MGSDLAEAVRKAALLVLAIPIMVLVVIIGTAWALGEWIADMVRG